MRRQVRLFRLTPQVKPWFHFLANKGPLTRGDCRDMSRHMTERTTVRLPDELVTRAKRKAAAEGRTLTALIEDGLRRVVNEPKAPAKRRKMPRISAAKGGLLPGVDLTNNASLQDLDDADDVERMKRFT
jgi:hypothetical protein